MTRSRNESALVATAIVLFTAFVVGAPQEAPPSPSAGTPATIPASVVAAAEKIANDPQVMALLKEQSTDAAAKARWNQFLELVRIPSPPRQELLKAAEIHRRLVNEWGFAPAEVMTRADGILAGTDTNIVDGLPVYNACVVIKGSYSSRADAQQYNGQFPKVLVEGHIDVVNPEELPKSGDPSIHIKLQPYAQPVVATPQELAAIPDELSFDARGRVVENDKYATASKVFANAKDAVAYGDACWSKVLMGWREWRDRGLTEHRNWWPDLYRNYCENQGIPPDPSTLAFHATYENSRADLQKVVPME